MKDYFVYLFLLFLSANFFCCSQEKHETDQILAKINDYELNLYEFQRQLSADLEFYTDIKLTDDTRKEFLEEMIGKELLIQEAKSLQIDRSENFIRAIERYWESTLIRDLLEMKGKEISQRILISMEETEAYYNQMKISQENLPPFAKLHEEITDKLKEKKKTEMLKDWIDGLRKKAKIEINNELLYENKGS